MARRATFIRKEINQGAWTLVLDAGDSLVGDMDPALRTKGKSSVEAMNRMGYHAMTLGSGDLALGLAVLRDRIAEARFPVLSANAYTLKEELVAKPYVIFASGGHQVAVLGLSDGAGTPEISVRDPVETARRVVPDLRSRADAVIILSHAGQEIDRRIADAVPGVAVIISGGDAAPSQPWISPASGVPVYHADSPSPGHAGRILGVARLAFDANGHLTTQTWRSVSLDPGYADDPGMSAWVTSQLVP